MTGTTERWREWRRTKWNVTRVLAYNITEVLGPVTYRLQLPATWRIHNVFHAALLRPFKENEVYGDNYTEPPPELVEGEEVYEVETILNHRRRGRGYQYFIKWRGYPISDASWEPEHAFSDDGDILRQYKHRHHLWYTSLHTPPLFHIYESL